MSEKGLVRHAVVQIAKTAIGHVGFCRCGWQTPGMAVRDDVFIRIADHDFIERFGLEEFKRRTQGQTPRVPFPWEPTR